MSKDKDLEKIKKGQGLKKSDTNSSERKHEQKSKYGGIIYAKNEVHEEQDNG